MNAPELTDEPIEVEVAAQHEGWRLDAFLADRFPLYSRVQLRRVINAAAAPVDGARTKAAYRLTAGQRVRIWLPDLAVEGPQPEDIPLDVLYEDDDLAAINKPPGMVVHPGKGHWQGTLTAALAFHFRQLSSAGGPTRPGIVHRLDRDTSGVIIVAKKDAAHLKLAAQFEARTVKKQYFALVRGLPDCDRDQIDQPIGLHPHHREKMTIRRDHRSSRNAVSFYEVQERFAGYAAVRVTPKTGRTHQIRVHLAHINCPVLCDRLYAGHAQLTAAQVVNIAARGAPGSATRNVTDSNSAAGDTTDSDTTDSDSNDSDSNEDRILLTRQALHAESICFSHPATGETVEIHAPIPRDIQQTLDFLRSHAPRNRG